MLRLVFFILYVMIYRLFFLLLLITSFSVFGQNSKKMLVYKTSPYELKYASNHIEEIINYNKNDSTVKMYIADGATVDSLIKRSTKPYKVVMIYTYWCPAVRENLPKFLSFINTNQEKFDLFLVTGDMYSKSPLRNKVALNNYYLAAELHYYAPVYILDYEKYGKRIRGFSRIDKYIEETCAICNTKKMGYTAQIVYGSKNEILYYAGWETSAEEDIKKLDHLPLD